MNPVFVLTNMKLINECSKNTIFLLGDMSNLDFKVDSKAQLNNNIPKCKLRYTLFPPPQTGRPSIPKALHQIWACQLRAHAMLLAAFAKRFDCSILATADDDRQSSPSLPAAI